MKTLHRTTAVAAVLLSTSLAACSQSKNNTGPEASSATGQTTQAAEQTSTQAASTQAASTPAQTPAGYQSISAPTTSISFAVPEGWQVVTGDDIQNDQSIPLPIATYGITDDQARLLLSSVDLAAASPTPNDTGLPDAVSVAPAAGVDSLPSEDAMSQRVSEQGAAPGEYSAPWTDLGQVAVMTATATAPELEVHSATITAPTRNGGWADIRVMTSDASRTRELTDVIMSTLSS